ncbi:MAG: NAD-dependent epimerase/dehydratase family protein [Blastocatellia bacterium]|nr:NAD-dependent epimerase/dehydratase family protein [Blastocatellia bacterium]
MSEILVTGGSGLVGSSLRKFLPDAVYLSSKDGDLTRERDAAAIFDEHRPRVVIHLAARVGGIMANLSEPVAFLNDNILLNTHVLENCRRLGVERVIALLSTCVYPDEAGRYPMNEDDLHSGMPTPTNFGYGYAKRLLAVQIKTYREQFGVNWYYLIPSNLYGENDHFDEKAHFVPALIAKIIKAKESGEKSVTLFGDGTPLRQFLYVDDLSRVILHWLGTGGDADMNVATPENLSIREIAEIALEACDAEGLEIQFDASKPNGQFRKDVSIERLLEVMPDFRATPLAEGIRKTYDGVYDKIADNAGKRHN